jgi:Concanavalin A-like lectin/glucanases superfamily
MMELIILLLQFKTFKMKLYFIILSFFLVSFSNAQIIQQSFIANGNAYPTSIGANASFDIESVTSGLAANTYPAIKSDFTFNFTNTTPYTIQFWVSKKVSNTASRGFIGFTTAADGLSYSAGSFLFYEFSGSTLRNFVKNDYLNDNITLAGFALNTMYQITTIYDGTNWRNYVNGQLVNTNRNTATFNSTANLMLGNIGGYTNIVLDEVRFWDKALTIDEITNNWNKPITGMESGLKLYYNFNNQGYAAEDNTSIKYLKDKSVNNYNGIFKNMALSGSQQNFISDNSPTTTYDSLILSIDANNLDNYPGNGRGTAYGNTNNKSAFIVHDLFSTTNFIFYNSASYNVNQLAAPILNADGGRSFLINNIYGKTNTASGISGYGRRTFEAWVKFNSLNNNSVVSIGNLANNDLFEMAANNNRLILSIGTDLTSNLNIKSNRTLNTNNWYHVVIVYNAYNVNGKIYYLYINGLLDNDFYSASSASQTSIDAFFTPQTTTNTNIYIGNSLRSFNGKLGLLKIYNREITATEVLNKYNASKSRFGY